MIRFKIGENTLCVLNGDAGFPNLIPTVMRDSVGMGSSPLGQCLSQACGRACRCIMSGRVVIGRFFLYKACPKRA